jgi:hypothetical protein
MSALAKSHANEFRRAHYTSPDLNRPKDWKCKYCGKVLKSATQTRLVDHLRGGSSDVVACPGPEGEENQTTFHALRDKLKREHASKVKAQEEQQKKKAELEDLRKRKAEADDTSSQAAKQTKIDSLKDVLKARLDRQWARYMYNAGLPFHVTDDPELDSFMKMLVSAVKAGLLTYSTPSRKLVGGRLLDEEYERVKTTVFELLFKEDDWLTIVTDGWSNRRRQAVMNYMLCSRRGTCFFKAVFPELVRKDHAYIAEELDKVYTEMLELKVPGVVGSCVTDNAPVMGKARDTLTTDAAYKERWEHITHNGCLLHWLDLLMEDICSLPFVDTVLETARTVSKYFRNHQMAADILRKLQKEHYGTTWEPPLPGDTRCGTKYIVLRWVVKSWSALQAAVTDAQWKDEATSPKNLVLSEKTHAQFMTVKDLLKPVWGVLRLADTDGAAFTPYVYPKMLAVQKYLKEFNTVERPEKLPAAAHQKAVKAVADRWQELHHPIYSAAWQLNPATTTPTNWKDIDDEAREDVQEIIKSFSDSTTDAAKAMSQLTDFRNRTGVFADPILWCSEAWEKGPLHWWDTYGTSAAELYRVCERVFSFVPVASAAERNWSCFGFIHSKLRARLYNHKTEKLVFLYQNYRLMRSRTKEGFQEPVLDIDLELDELE